VIEDALGGEHLDLVLEETDSPSNLAAAGQKRRARVAQAGATGGAAEAAKPADFGYGQPATILRLAAQNAVECALDLRRLRPQGKVQ